MLIDPNRTLKEVTTISKMRGKTRPDNEIWCNYTADSFGVVEMPFDYCDIVQDVTGRKYWIDSKVHAGVMRNGLDLVFVFEKL